ncbi:MAG: tetratricopeptide repeat protein [Deltaproteobacteria bacterium]|nr:tetratricopeptide repeat protein [Deltaproteobacteria bacterium]
MPAQKLSRKELLKTPDEFLTVSERAISYVTEHSKEFTTGLLVILAVLVIFLGGRWYSNYTTEKALAAYNLAVADITRDKKLDLPSMEAAIKALDQVTVQHSGTAPARYALLDLADLYYRSGQYAKAENAYQKFLDGLKSQEESVKPLVLDGLAHALEAQGNLAQAAAKWEQIIALPGDLMKAEAYSSLGRVYQAQGQAEASRKAYRELVSGYPNTIQANLARTKIPGLGK